MADWRRRIIGTGALCLALAGTLAGRADVPEAWRMPTTAEMEALVSNCTTTWTTRNTGTRATLPALDAVLRVLQFEN